MKPAPSDPDDGAPIERLRAATERILLCVPCSPLSSFSTSMRRRALIAALVITFLVGACSDTTSSTPAAQAHSSPLPSGLTLTCNRYQSSGSMGPLEDGRYVHYVCQNGKVTSWWVDDNSGT